jgi:hypothetical protein
MTSKGIASSVVTALVVVFTIPCAIVSVSMAKAFAQHHRDVKSGMRWE